MDETLTRLRGPFLAHHPPTAILGYLEEAFRFTQSRPEQKVHAEFRARAKGIAVFSNMNDQPFIVDTIRLFLKTRGADYLGGFNLVFGAVRDAFGNLTDVGGPEAEAESLVMLEAEGGWFDEVTDAGQLVAAGEHLAVNLEHSRAMVRDFKLMTRTIERFVERCDVLADRRPDQSEAMRETGAFLKWLLGENFVFVGVDAGPGSEPLGIQALGGPFHNDASGAWPPPHPPSTVQVRKSRFESPVHRAGRIDEILVRVGRADDPLSMELFIRGMFTYRAITQPSRNVPILRTMLGEILAEQTASPGSFRYKGIANVFDSLPTEFLFTATKQSIAEMVDLVFEAEQQQEVGVTFMMSARRQRVLPRRHAQAPVRPTSYGGAVEDRDRQKRRKATYADHGLFVGRYDSVLLHYYLTGVTVPGRTGRFCGS